MTKPTTHNNIRHRFYTARTWGNPEDFPMLNDIAQRIQNQETPEYYRTIGYKISRFIHSFNRTLKKFTRPWRLSSVTVPQLNGGSQLVNVNLLTLAQLDDSNPHKILAKLVGEIYDSKDRLDTLKHFLWLHREKTVKENMEQLDLPNSVKADLRGFTRAKTNYAISQIEEAYQNLLTYNTNRAEDLDLPPQEEPEEETQGGESNLELV